MVALLLPLAAAESASGEFIVQGTASLPEDAAVRMTPLLAFLGETKSLQGLTLSAPSARIHLFEGDNVRSPGVGPYRLDLETTTRSVSYPASDVSLTFLSGRAPGYVGLYPAPEANLRAAAPSGVTVEVRQRTEVTTLVSTSATAEDPFETWYAYRQVEDRPHLVCTLAGHVTYQGPGTLKLFGVDFRLESANESRVVTTGAQEGPGPQVTYRWAIVEFPDGAFGASSTFPWILAAREIEGHWDGQASFDAMYGEMEGKDARYLPGSGVARLEGSFSAALVTEEGERADPLARLLLKGDLRDTTLRREALASGDPVSSGSLLILLVGVAIGATGAAGGLWVSRWRRTPGREASAVALEPFTAEDCCDAGAKAASEEDWASAAKWFRRAHALAPTSARICADLGFSLSQIGDVEEALSCFAKASDLSSDGEADFNAALVALQGDRPLEEVEAWLERALERTPGLVLPLDSDNDFHVLAGRAGFEAAVQRARARVGAGRLGGDGYPLA